MVLEMMEMATQILMRTMMMMTFSLPHLKNVVVPHLENAVALHLKNNATSHAKNLVALVLYP